MKKLFVFLAWFVVSTVITVGTYTLVFLIEPSIPIAGFVAVYVIMVTMFVLMFYIKDTTNSIPFFTCITTCFMFSGLESLVKQSSVGFDLLFGIIMVMASIVSFIILVSSIKTTFDIETNTSYLKVTGLFIVFFSLVQVLLVTGAIYYISNVL